MNTKNVAQKRANGTQSAKTKASAEEAVILAAARLNARKEREREEIAASRTPEERRVSREQLLFGVMDAAAKRIRDLYVWFGDIAAEGNTISDEDLVRGLAMVRHLECDVLEVRDEASAEIGRVPS